MDNRELIKRFTHHPPKPGQIDKYEEIRTMAFGMSTKINQVCPDSREKSTAITKLEEVVFWANASIARREV